MPITEKLNKLLKDRILLMDGAMGTMIQRHQLSEDEFRGNIFKDWVLDLKGNNDILSLTRPDLIQRIHRDYLEAGADIIETNTFNANAFSQADYRTEDWVYELNKQSALIAKNICFEYTASFPSKPRFVAGAIGPTNRTTSLSPDVNRPEYRSVSFDEMVTAYTEQITGLIDGGVDILLIETIFDTLNCKAAIFAIETIFEQRGIRLPVMISVTITDASGRTLSGQTVEAFWVSVQHARPFSIGLNCALGPKEMRPHLQVLSAIAPAYISAYPNAGLPNELGEYDQAPAETQEWMRTYIHEGLVNIIGGCCGTTPDHIALMGKLLSTAKPRGIPQVPRFTQLSGLEPLIFREGLNFVNIGERTNVTGSRQFARLIKTGNYAEATKVALQQVEAGAQIIDVNMDEGLLESKEAMIHFLNLIGSEPAIARVPVMIDSSKFEVIEAGLKCLQGKGIVNSISLKEGEASFLHQARLVNRYGAAMVVMAFDELGQADTVARKVDICSRAYRLLTLKAHIPAEDIIFDPNIFAIGTGIPEHNQYAINFITAIKQIKLHCPGVKISGGISNISFAFRGNDHIREAMHAAFLYHAIRAGMDMGIVNAGMIEVYEEIDPQLLILVEDVIFDRHPNATEKLLEYAGTHQSAGKSLEQKTADWRHTALQERITHALIKGIDDFVEEDMAEALPLYDSPLFIIEYLLMEGMNAVGDLFGAGKMFLPQVVKSARVMKKAVAYLTPYIEAQKSASERSYKGKILLATVKGDVHDIGKNIVGVVLGCNNYQIIDLGVMVRAEIILNKAREEQVDVIGLSGLITPSLDEMVHVAKEMEWQKFGTPLIIGGATTSKLHTALKVEPHYSGPVVHVIDASKSVAVVSALLNSDSAVKDQFLTSVRTEYAQIRERRKNQDVRKDYVPIQDARSNKLVLDWNAYTPPAPHLLGVFEENPPLDDLLPYIDWTPFFSSWEMAGRYPDILQDPVVGVEAQKLFDEAQVLLNKIVTGKLLTPKGVWGLFEANSNEQDEVELKINDDVLSTFYFLRQQRQKTAGQPNFCLSDFIAPLRSGVKDYLGVFVVTAGIGLENLVQHYESQHDDYHAIMSKALADRLAEAFAEYMHEKIRTTYWGYEHSVWTNDELIKESYQGIRPAPGYPSCPDHTEKITIFALLDATSKIGVHLTESLAMYPTAAICGWYFSHPQAKYFGVGQIGQDQVSDYARRKNYTIQDMERWLTPWLNY